MGVSQVFDQLGAEFCDGSGVLGLISQIVDLVGVLLAVIEAGLVAEVNANQVCISR